MKIEPYTNPFTVLIDTQEGQPFSFHGLQADADKEHRPLVVPVRWLCLGRHPHSKGDYSIEGLQERIGVERKSREDCWGTVLGWETQTEKKLRDKNATEATPRRERFKRELENLAKLDAALVVVEASLEDCLTNVPEWGSKPAHENRKIFNRSILSMMQDFHVPWLFCDSRRLAEIETFRYLERFWRKDQDRIRAEKREAKAARKQVEMEGL